MKTGKVTARPRGRAILPGYRDGRMGDGRWAMGDGRWAMGDGRWAMGDGRWKRYREPVRLHRLSPNANRPLPWPMAHPSGHRHERPAIFAGRSRGVDDARRQAPHGIVDGVGEHAREADPQL